MFDTLSSLIQQPWSLSPNALLGATLVALVAALAGEVVWRLWRWPRLLGYGLVGTALALAEFGIDGRDPMTRLTLDAALAVLLFEAGSRLNLRWLRHNTWLLGSSVLEALLTAVAVYVVATQMGVERDVAVTLALILMASAPALALRVVSEVNASGQVTERLIALSALNTLYAVVALQLASAGLSLNEPQTWTQALGPVAFGFFGSIVLAALVGEGINFVTRRFDLRHDNAVLLMVGCVMLALIVAKTLHLSTLMVPLLTGLWLRNRSERPWVWPRHFGSLGAVLVLGLFVLVNASWAWADVRPVLVIAAIVLAVRWLAKTLGVALLAKPSGLSAGQALWLGGALMPVSASAWVLGLDFSVRHSGQGQLLMALLLACIALLELVSPWIVMACLRGAGEVDRTPARDAVWPAETHESAP